MDIPKSKCYSLIPEATDEGNLIVLYMREKIDHQTHTETISIDKYCPFKMQLLFGSSLIILTI